MQTPLSIHIIVVLSLGGCFFWVPAYTSEARQEIVQEQATPAKVLATIPFSEEDFGIPKRCENVTVALSVIEEISRSTSRSTSISANLTYPEKPGETFDFDATNEPNFEAVVGVLTNNRDDYVATKLSFANSSMTAAKHESRYFPGDTDLVRYNITLIRLTLNRFSITSGASWDDYDTANLDIDWEIWGYRLRSNSTSTGAFMAFFGFIGLVAAAIKAQTKRTSLFI